MIWKLLHSGMNYKYCIQCHQKRRNRIQLYKKLFQDFAERQRQGEQNLKEDGGD